GGRRGREVGRRRGGGRRHGGGGGRGGRGGAGRLSRRRQGAGRLQDDLVAGSVGGVHERQLVAELELRRRLAAVEGAADDGELDRLAVAGDRDEPEDVLVRRERALHGHLLADAVGREQGVGGRGGGSAGRRAGRGRVGRARRAGDARGHGLARGHDRRRRGGRAAGRRRVPGRGSARGRSRLRGRVGRELLDERVLALEEPERDQLVGAPGDRDPVGVRQLARGERRRDAGRARGRDGGGGDAG